MTKKTTTDSEFSALFKDAKKVISDKYVPSRQEKQAAKHSASKVIYNAATPESQKQRSASVAISDVFEAYWPENQAISFVREKDGEHKDLVKKLKLGLIPPDYDIDLHGLTAQQAKEELLSVIFEAKQRHSPCINVIHGHGNGILKQKIPNWLVQHPDVSAFVKAPKAFGGNAGLLVLVNIDFTAFKL